MNLQLSQAAGGALSTQIRCPPKFTHPVPPLFSYRRPKFLSPKSCSKSQGPVKPLVVSADSTSGGGGGTKSDVGAAGFGVEDTVSVVGGEDVPYEGVIQFEEPSSSTSSRLLKWGQVAMLAGGDVLAILFFSAVGRFSHGFPVFDTETWRTADPFVAGWFLSAYFLGGYGDGGRGLNGRSNAITTALKSWALGIPLGIGIRATGLGHVPPANFILVTMGSTGLLLVGWRALFSTIFSRKSKKNDDYKRGNAFELFELLMSLVRRW